VSMRREPTNETSGPELVTQISTALAESCEAFARLSGQPVNTLTKDVLAKRIMRCIDSGETDPEKWKAFALGGFGKRDERSV
jgi:hypothetical protein